MTRVDTTMEEEEGEAGMVMMTTAMMIIAEEVVGRVKTRGCKRWNAVLEIVNKGLDDEQIIEGGGQHNTMALV